jgi:hypothetical protein
VLIAETVAVAFPVFVITMDCVLLVPATMLPNKSDDALAFSVADGTAVAVPLNETSCGLDAALSVNVTAPVRVPVAVGENVTEIVQLPPAARLVAQLLVWAKSPDAPMLLIERTAEPLLVRVIACAALLVPIAWLAKVKLLGERLTAAAIACAVPVTAIFAGVFDALLATAIVPDCAPADAGTKLTVRVADCPELRVRGKLIPLV